MRSATLKNPVFMLASKQNLENLSPEVLPPCRAVTLLPIFVNCQAHDCVISYILFTLSPSLRLRGGAESRFRSKFATLAALQSRHKIVVQQVRVDCRLRCSRWVGAYPNGLGDNEWSGVLLQQARDDSFKVGRRSSTRANPPCLRRFRFNMHVMKIVLNEAASRRDGRIIRRRFLRSN